MDNNRHGADDVQRAAFYEAALGLGLFMRIGLLMNIIILAANIFIVNVVYPLTPLQ